MAEHTSIEWCDHTLNPWIGCTKVSPGCDHCYAARQDGFRRWTPEGWGGPRRRTSAQLWRDPAKWNAQPFCECMGCHWRGPRSAAGSKNNPAGFDRDPGVMLTCPTCKQPLLKEARARVFCASLADVFDNEVPEHWRWDLFRLIAATPHLDWLLLTKRIGNARPMLNSAAAAVAGDFVEAPTWDVNPWPNVWLGATVVNQAEANRDITKLMRVPARVRFLSIEPMLGPIDLAAAGGLWLNSCGSVCNQKTDKIKEHGGDCIDWVICGGESGPGARPMHPEWARSLRDQCAAAGVAFMMKQWGEWADERHVVLDQPIASRLRKTVSRLSIDGTVYPMHGPGPERYAGIYRVGKKAAGRLLDGVQHDGFPKP